LPYIAKVYRTTTEWEDFEGFLQYCPIQTYAFWGEVIYMKASFDTN